MGKAVSFLEPPPSGGGSIQKTTRYAGGDIYYTYKNTFPLR